ncbi:MAG TPA: BMP family ABC transporter substrate-binding protein, partial [Anaerolineae bacterium]|nr:BMP family ABC transporter substrate-binding protein [Anaerolineae bacterium]
MTSHKHLSVFSLLLIWLSLALAGCSAGQNSAAADPAQAAPGAFKVALLLPGPADDAGWSQAGYEGLKLIEKELGAEVAYTANVPEAESEQEKITRQYAADGFNFIIGQGGEYIPAFEVVAKEFPQTQFVVVTDYAGNNKNFGAVATRPEEGGYLGGVIAALKTKTN